jgi:hypothetical protein
MSWEKEFVRMSSKKKFLKVLVPILALAAFMVVPSMASATISGSGPYHAVSNGQISLTSTTLGSVDCNVTLTASLSNDAAGTGTHGTVTADANTACTGGLTVVGANLPWNIAVDNNLGGGLWGGQIDGVTVGIAAVGCTWTEDPTDPVTLQYDNGTSQATITGGSLLGSSGFCGTANLTGVFDLTDSSSNTVTLG